MKLSGFRKGRLRPPQTLLHFFTNRKIKDRLFRAIFTEDKAALLQLYNALHGTAYTDEKDLTIVTMENIVYMSMKNDLAFVISGVLNLYEHQSSFNPNMPLRFLLYLAQEYQKLIAQQKQNIYGSKLISLPTPQFIVFYNGDRETPDEFSLRLSDAFEKPSAPPDIELTVHMLNINLGHNEELLRKCPKLWEYAYLVKQIKSNLSLGMNQHQAIDHALTHCIRNDILADFLLQNRMEVLGMLLTEYNERKVMRALRKEAIEDGRAEGWEQGISQGISQGRTQGISNVNTLNRYLIRDSRIDDLIRASSDPVFQEQLMQEYRIANRQEPLTDNTVQP